MFSEESNNDRKIMAFLDNKVQKTRENDMKIELSKAKALDMAFFAKNEEVSHDLVNAVNEFKRVKKQRLNKIFSDTDVNFTQAL